MAATVVVSSMRRILLVLLGVKTMGWAWLWHGGHYGGHKLFTSPGRPVKPIETSIGKTWPEAWQILLSFTSTMSEHYQYEPNPEMGW